MSVAKSRHQIATEIAKWYTREGTGYADRLYQLAYAIEAALKDRDERAARIAERHAETHGNMHFGRCEIVIAAAIRNEDADD